MGRKLGVIPLVGLCALLLALSAGAAGCAGPWSSSAPPQTLAANTVVDQAIAQLQAALDLPDGAISRSSSPPILPGSDVALRWQGGKADVDLETGRIRAILIDLAPQEGPDSETTTSLAPSTTSTTMPVSTSTTKASKKKSKTTTTTAAPTTTSTAPPTTTSTTNPTTTLPRTALDEEADRILAFLGWDSATLTAQGFTPDHQRFVDHGTAGKAYERSWTGHDSGGIPNLGIIEVGLDAITGELRNFLYDPGPRAALDITKTITRTDAVKTAKEAMAKSSPGTQTPPKRSGEETTTSTATYGWGGGPTTTTTASARVDSAVLVHTDKPGMTGGADMLIWIVKLSKDSSTGVEDATVYIDAVSGEVLEL